MLQVFRGDATALSTCRTEARAQFRRNASVADPKQIQKLIADANDAADFLRNSIVQAKLNEAGRYEMKLNDNMVEKGSNSVKLQDATTACEGGKANVADNGSGDVSSCGPSCGCR